MRCRKFSQHNHYEKVLKNRLKECIQQGEAYAYLEPAIRFADFSTLIDYIEATHEKYLNKLRSVEEDIRFILNMCFQVVQGLIQICIGNKNFAGAIRISLTDDTAYGKARRVFKDIMQDFIISAVNQNKKVQVSGPDFADKLLELN